jgi:large subunit ribosomal protein L20
MPRTKTGTVRRASHKKVLKLTKGFRMTRNRLYKVAHEALLHAGQYAFDGRKKRKGQFRTTWITRINAALKTYGSSLRYSEFINSLKTKNVTINRKMMSELAIKLPESFKSLVTFTSSK